jgi:hypothetical protein
MYSPSDRVGQSVVESSGAGAFQRETGHFLGILQNGWPIWSGQTTSLLEPLNLIGYSAAGQIQDRVHGTFGGKGEYFAG